MTRSLGLDIGDKRIGVALSDPGGILATPLTIVDRIDNARDIEIIINLIDQHQVKVIVVGLPRLMNGIAGEQAEKVRTFAQQLRRRTKVPVEYRDERLTTVSARRLMQSATTRKTRKKVRDDAVAAALILQSYLDEKAKS